MVAISVTPRSIWMTRNVLSKIRPLMKRAIERTPDFSNMVRKRAYSSSVNRTMTHFFAGSALRGLPGFPCLLREIRSSIAFNFAWRRRSSSVFNVDRYPADDNAIILSFRLSGGRGSDLGLFHKAKLPRGIIGCIRVRDANHCHTDANHCHGQNMAGSLGWNVYGLSVKDNSERLSFLCPIWPQNNFAEHGLRARKDRSMFSGWLLFADDPFARTRGADMTNHTRTSQTLQMVFDTIGCNTYQFGQSGT